MPKVVDHDAYRRRLLFDSFEIAAKLGYGTLSMKQLARSLKISTGLIYHYFENKEEWFVSLVVLYSSQVMERLTQEVPADAPLPEKLMHLVRHIDRHKDLFANLIGVASDYVRMPSSENREGVIELAMVGDRLYEYFAALFETDEQRARALVAHIIGVVVANRLDPKGVDVLEQLPFIQAVLECNQPRLGAGASR